MVASSNGSPRRIRLGDGGRERGEVVIVDVLLHQDAFAGRAALAGVEEAGRERGLDRGVEIRVLEHHQRPVAAHLEQQLLARRPLGHAMTGGDRADEPDGRDAGVRGHLVAHHRARARHQVEGTRRQVGLADRSGERHRAHAGRRRRCQDDGVPAREGGREDLSGHRVRPVPRADDARHAARYAVARTLGCLRSRTAGSGPRRARRRPPPSRSTRSAPRPRRTPPPAAACPGPAPACAPSRPVGHRSPRRRGASPARGRRP